jgi:hypothetical protein
MTNATGTVSYEGCSNEDCGIARPGDERRTGKIKNMITVQAFTYDDFAKAQGIEFADLVKIDTEGQEPLIIQGMHETLKAKKVGFLAFEVHGTGKGWYHAFDMTRLVDLLDAYGYTCYMNAMDKGRIHMLTGCNSRRFSQSYTYDGGRSKWWFPPKFYDKIRGVIPQWGNAVCGLRDHAEIKQILQKLNSIREVAPIYPEPV